MTEDPVSYDADQGWAVPVPKSSVKRALALLTTMKRMLSGVEVNPNDHAMHVLTLTISDLERSLADVG